MRCPDPLPERDQAVENHQPANSGRVDIGLPGTEGSSRKLPWVWTAFVLWLLVQVPTFVGQAEQGKSPINFLAYRAAADALERGESPYGTPERRLQRFREIHQAETDLRSAAARGEAPAMLQELEAREQQPGLYLYPPTLARLISGLRLNGLAFAGLILLSMVGFGRLWLGGPGASSHWLLLIMFSWDVLASWYGGNVELVLLGGTLAAARLLWTRHTLLAAPLIAPVVLIKPFYAMFFVTFGLLQLVSRPTEAGATLRSLAAGAALALAIMATEVDRWGATLRAQTFDYLLHGVDYLWFVLPPADQTPLSAWNRTPLQALVSAGLPATTAQRAALGLWLLFVVITLRRAWWSQLAFPPAFALSLILLYWGRPVGWGLIYLEVVLVVAAWPSLRGWQRGGLLGALLALMASHWWALVLTLRGAGMSLFTLQSADFPWETWSVLPLAWLLLLKTVSHTTARHGQRMGASSP